MVSTTKVKALKQKIEEILTKILGMYDDHIVIMPILESPDFIGKTCLDYAIQFELYDFMGSEIMR